MTVQDTAQQTPADRFRVGIDIGGTKIEAVLVDPQVNVRNEVRIPARRGNAQVIDDEVGHTLAAASTLDAEVKAQLEGKNKKEAANLVGEIVARRALDKGVKDFEGVGSNKEAAKKVGMTVAQRAKEKGIDKVVFDRGGYLYTGRVAEVAEGARKAGLEF